MENDLCAMRHDIFGLVFLGYVVLLFVLSFFSHRAGYRQGLADSASDERSMK